MLSGPLPATQGLANLSLLPTSGTKFYVHRSDWEQLYAENLTDAEKEKIIAALNEASESIGTAPDKVWGEVIEDRGTQITFSALGQEAPLEEKKGNGIPDFTKRKKMKALLDVHPRVLRAARRRDLRRRHEAGHRQGLRDKEATGVLGIDIGT